MEFTVLFFSSFDTHQWHQVDFLEARNLSGLLTQGSPDYDRWVTTYTISTSLDGYTFYPVRDHDGSVVIYNGNSDRNTIVRNYFPRVSNDSFHHNIVNHLVFMHEASRFC